MCWRNGPGPERFRPPAVQNADVVHTLRETTAMCSTQDANLRGQSDWLSLGHVLPPPPDYAGRSIGRGPRNPWLLPKTQASALLPHQHFTLCGGGYSCSNMRGLSERSLCARQCRMPCVPRKHIFLIQALLPDQSVAGVKYMPETEFVQIVRALENCLQQNY